MISFFFKRFSIPTSFFYFFYAIFVPIFLFCVERYVYNWINKDNNFKNKVNEILEAQIDLVESKLIEKIQNNDLGAIIFYLKTKAKNRGYTKKPAVEMNINEPKTLKVEFI